MQPTDQSKNKLPYGLGLPMWSNRQWLGSLFPKGDNSSRFLSHYSAVFNRVEGNTTFYALPDKKTVESWRSQVNDNFRFCFKFPRKITHENSLRYCGVELSEFFNKLEPLAENFGPFMIQLPDSFGPGQLGDLKRFTLELPKSFNYSVEVRHRDFFNRSEEEQQLNRLLHEQDIDRVCFDSRALFSRPAISESEKDAYRKKPKLPVHAIATGQQPIIRFIGSSDPLCNHEFLIPWQKKIMQWLQEGKHPTMFIHTPDNLEAPQQAIAFHQMLDSVEHWRPLSITNKDESQLAIF